MIGIKKMTGELSLCAKFEEILKIVLQDRGYTTKYFVSDKDNITFAGTDKNGYRAMLQFSKRDIEMNAQSPNAVIAMLQTAIERNEEINADMRWTAEQNAKAVMAIKPPPHPNSKLAKLMVKIGETRLAPISFRKPYLLQDWRLDLNG